MKSDTISDWFLRGHTNLVAFSRFCETNYYLISCAKQTYHPGIVHVEEDSCKATFSLTHRSLAQHPVPQTWAGIGTGASLWSTVPILVRDQDEERDRKTTGGFSMPRPGVGNYGGEKPISLDPSSTARGRAHTQQGGESCHGEDQSSVKPSADPRPSIQWEKAWLAVQSTTTFTD